MEQSAKAVHRLVIELPPEERERLCALRSRPCGSPDALVYMPTPEDRDFTLPNSVVEQMLLHSSSGAGVARG